MVTNKFALSAALLLAPGLHAASPLKNFATGVASLTAATAVTLAGYNYGPSRADILPEGESAPARDNNFVLKSLALSTGVYIGFKLANFGHKKLAKATNQSSLLKRIYHAGNGIVSLALFYNTFLKTSRNRNFNPWQETTTTGRLDAVSNALATYGLVTWGAHLLNNAGNSLSTAFEKEETNAAH